MWMFFATCLKINKDARPFNKCQIGWLKCLYANNIITHEWFIYRNILLFIPVKICILIPHGLPEEV